MDRTDTQRSRRVHLRNTILKGLFLYVLVPTAILWLLARPLGDAVRQDETAVFRILPAALGAVLLNWLVYRLIRRKLPSLLVFSQGVLCLLAVVIILQEALPPIHSMTSALITSGAFLALVCAILLYFWFASRTTKFEHSLAVLIRVLLDMLLVYMVYRIARDFESKLVSPDTWIAAVYLVTLVVGFSIPKILAACRRSAARRRKTGRTEGRIVQIIGETYLDRDDDAVTKNHARIEYTVDDVPYETRAEISRYTTRKFGRKAFIGQEVTVCYLPENPGDAYVDRIDSHFFDNRPLNPSSEEPEGETENSEAGTDSNTVDE